MRGSRVLKRGVLALALAGLVAGIVSAATSAPTPVKPLRSKPSSSGAASKTHFEETDVSYTAADTDLLATDFTPTLDSSTTAFTVATITTNSVLNLIVKKSGRADQTVALNDGTALTAGRLYRFTVDGSSGVSFNLQVATACRVSVLFLRELN